MSIKKFKVLVDDRFHQNHVDLTNLLDIKFSDYPTKYFEKNDDILSVISKLKEEFIKQYRVGSQNIFWKQIAERLMKFQLIEIEIKIQKSHESLKVYSIIDKIELPGADDLTTIGNIIIIKDDKVFIREENDAFRYLDQVSPLTIKVNDKFFYYNHE